MKNMSSGSDFARDWRRWTRVERFTAALVAIGAPAVWVGIASLVVAAGR